MKFTEEEYKQVMLNAKSKSERRRLEVQIPKPLPPQSKMNKTEARYVTEVLDPQKYTKEILDWMYEPFNIRLADKTFYRVDFLVITSVVEFHEVKGAFIRDDAIVKWKVAAEQFPWFKWVLAQYKRGWQIKT